MAAAPTAERRRGRRPALAAGPEPAASTDLAMLPPIRRGIGGNSIIASAAQVPLENLGWDKPKATQAWQRELWRLLDIIGELRYAQGWIASHFSRAVLRMHDVGEDGEIAGETKNEAARKIAASVLGRPAERRETMRMAAGNLWLAGEVYVGALSGTGPRGRDEWFAVSTDDIQRDSGTGQAYVDLGDGKRYLRPGRDMLMRCWTPHFRKAAEADSAARSVRIVLRELEKLTLFIFAQIDSRLASGGVFIVPAGMSTTDGTTTTSTPQDLMASFVETAAEALKGEGTAAAIVPIVMEVPPDALGKLQHITWSSNLSEQALKLREEASARLARNLDIPFEEMQGVGDTTNHWSSFQIGPDGIKKHIEPLLARFCLALQRGWVDTALAAAGLDPDKFHIWYDTTPLIVRPQQFQEALELWREGRLSARALLEAAGFYPDQDAPTPDEDVQRYLRELVLRDPQLFNQASVRKLLGITDEMLPPSQVQQIDAGAGPGGQPKQLLTDSGTPPPPPPAPEKVPSKPVAGRVPQSRDRASEGRGGQKAVAASAGPDTASPVIVSILAGTASLRALELAGGRLLDHSTRGRLKDVPRYELHTHIPVSRDTHDLDKLLAGGVEALPVIAALCGMTPEWAGQLARVLHDNCVNTLLSGEPYNHERTISALQVAGLINGLD